MSNWVEDNEDIAKFGGNDTASVIAMMFTPYNVNFIISKMTDLKIKS